MIVTNLIFSLLASSSRTSKATIKPLEADVQFHSWCKSIGIEVSSVQLATSPLSVAGRGVFALDDIAKGDTVVKIPAHCVFAPNVAAKYFPSVANDLRRRHRRNQGWLRRIIRRNVVKPNDNLWQAELTAYALAAVESDHPWALWINQWQRNDPVSRLFEDGVVSSDENSVSAAAIELQKMVPQLSELHIQAAIQIRLQRFEKHEKIYLREKNSDDGKKASIARMYAILSSRALDLGDDIVGVVPMYDMINHSLDPNIGLFFDGGNFELFALRNLNEGEELFLCYNELEQIENNKWDDIQSLWTLIQWGIPISTEDANRQLDAVSRKILNH